MAPGEVLGRVAVEHRNAFALYTKAGEISGEVSGRLRHQLLKTVRSMGILEEISA
jgi:hypothetical protein